MSPLKHAEPAVAIPVEPAPVLVLPALSSELVGAVHRRIVEIQTREMGAAIGGPARPYTVADVACVVSEIESNFDAFESDHQARTKAALSLAAWALLLAEVCFAESEELEPHERELLLVLAERTADEGYLAPCSGELARAGQLLVGRGLAEPRPWGSSAVRITEAGRARLGRGS